jgi:hypothetical protein
MAYDLMSGFILGKAMLSNIAVSRSASLPLLYGDAVINQALEQLPHAGGIETGEVLGIGRGNDALFFE